MLEECARAITDSLWLLAFTHLLAFLAGVGSFAIYHYRFRFKRRQEVGER